MRDESENVKETSLFFMRFSHFPLINVTQIVVAPWLISRVLKTLILTIFLPAISLLFWGGTGFEEVLTLPFLLTSLLVI